MIRRWSSLYLIPSPGRRWLPLCWCTLKSAFTLLFLGPAVSRDKWERDHQASMSTLIITSRVSRSTDWPSTEVWTVIRGPRAVLSQFPSWWLHFESQKQSSKTERTAFVQVLHCHHLAQSGYIYENWDINIVTICPVDLLFRAPIHALLLCDQIQDMAIIVFTVGHCASRLFKIKFLAPQVCNLFLAQALYYPPRALTINLDPGKEFH